MPAGSPAVRIIVGSWFVMVVRYFLNFNEFLTAKAQRKKNHFRVYDDEYSGDFSLRLCG
jgi:hypothetical protein